MVATQDCDAAQKKQLVYKLNKQAQSDRDAILKQKFLAEAANVIRSRLVVVNTAAEAKRWMESSMPGFVARCVVVDVGQSSRLQTASKSRNISKAPTDSDAKVWADSIMTLPVTPVVGGVLVRPCQHSSVQKFLALLDKTHKYQQRKKTHHLCKLFAYPNGAKRGVWTPPLSFVKEARLNFSLASCARWPKNKQL